MPETGIGSDTEPLESLQEHSGRPLIAFNKKGEQMLAELVKCFPEPVLMLGDTGWGKSVLARAATRILHVEYSSINAHPGMDMGMLVGMWRPHSKKNNGGISVVWEDGLLTRRIRSGGAFLLEELTRAPQEAVSRLHGILDTMDRYWSLPEAGQESVKVHENFWFIATANPPGKGYASQRVEKALHSRFIAHFEVNEPLANEQLVVEKIVASPALAIRMVRVAIDCRNREESRMCTRDLVQWAVLIKRGFKPKRAFQLAVSPKFSEHTEAMTRILEAHITD